MTRADVLRFSTFWRRTTVPSLLTQIFGVSRDDFSVHYNFFIGTNLIKLGSCYIVRRALGILKYVNTLFRFTTILFC